MTPARESSTNPKTPKLTVLTIGHSTHPFDEFVAILKAHDVAQLVDVRTVPKSRHVPQYNTEVLARELPLCGVDYVPMKALGGLRKAAKDSINTGWRNASFRGYADYMATEEFRNGIDRLLELAAEKRTVVMCAEAVPWRCHRSLIGDALLARGVSVEDIMNAKDRRTHTLTSFARVQGSKVIYDGDKPSLFSK